MKYMTREWYALGQTIDYCIDMKPVADKVYSDEEINAFYQCKLKQEIKIEKESYNLPPDFIPIDLDDPDFHLDNYVAFNPETGKLRKYTSKQELADEIAEEQRQRIEEFNNRPPFDETAAIKEFEERYRAIQTHVLWQFPEYIRGRIDPRLAALDLLPRSVYEELNALSRINKKKFDAINKAARKELSKQKIPKQIKEEFGYHDGDVLSIDPNEHNLIMTIRRDCGAFFDGETPFTRVTFINAEIVESDFKLPFRYGDDYCVWLYEELYRLDNGKIEAHMFLSAKYLTVRCDDMEFENNLDPDKIGLIQCRR